MKKLAIFGVCALMSLGASAQQDVLKAAKKAVDKQPYEEVLNILKPAFSNPETANSPETYFLAGKAGIETFKRLDKQLRAQPERTSAVAVQAANALIGGYDYLMKAIELEKDAPKPKYTKDAVKLLTYVDEFTGINVFKGFNQAAEDFYNAKDYAKAFRGWQIYVTLADNPLFANNKGIQLEMATTNKGNIYYNMGVMAASSDMMAEAYDSFLKAIENGYENKEAYDYLLMAATNLEDPAKVKEAAMMGYHKFGKEDERYIGNLINGYLNDKNYTEAIALIDQAISDFPEAAQYYYIKGYILEQDGVEGDPMEMYKKAIAINPDYDDCLFEMGYYVLRKAGEIIDNAPVDPSQYKEVKDNQVRPLLNECIGYLEKAYLIKQDKDADLHDTELLLKNAYYLLDQDPDAMLQKLQK